MHIIVASLVTYGFFSRQMEKYSNHLEALVAERTQELIVEQNKTATLLYSKKNKTC